MTATRAPSSPGSTGPRATTATSFGISVRLHDDQGGLGGLLVATLPAGPSLGSIRLDPGAQGFAPAVLADRDRDRDRPDTGPRPEKIFFLLRDQRPGEARPAAPTEIFGSGVAHLVKVPDTPFTVIVRVDTPSPSPR